MNITIINEEELEELEHILSGNFTKPHTILKNLVNYNRTIRISYIDRILDIVTNKADNKISAYQLIALLLYEMRDPLKKILTSAYTKDSQIKEIEKLLQSTYLDYLTKSRD